MLGKIGTGRTDSPTAAEVLHAATATNADALGRDDLGRIREGALADWSPSTCAARRSPRC